MVTSPTPVPPRREGRRLAIPTPADLLHPRQRRAADETPEAGPDPQATTVPATPAPGPPRPPAAATQPSTVAPPIPAPMPVPAPTPAPAAMPVPAPLPVPLPVPMTAAPPAPRPPHEGSTLGEPRPQKIPTPADLRPAARPADEPAPEERPVAPTPATLPRRHRPESTAAPTLRPEPPEAPPRRMFPNPVTLVPGGRGGRKVRPGGLRGRRLPKVEETSAGGVVLDLSRHPAAVALIARHDRRSRLLWSLPKGHVEDGEIPEETALREVHEETGLLGRIIAPLGVIDFWFVVEDRRIHKTVHHFVIEAIGGQLSDEDVEVEAVEWVPYDQVVRKLAYGDERRLVEKVAQIVPGVR